MIQILIVEDEHPISNLICMNLEDAGYQCTCVSDGMAAADILEDHTFDLILLDIMLPQINGFELLEYIKPMKIPVIFLTARGDLSDRVKGLTAGAEDYIVKPFEIVELMARIQVVLRRFHKTDITLSYRDIVVDTENHTVTRAGIPLELTHKEYELLVLFLRNPNITLYRDRIFECIWEQEYTGDTRTLDLHIQRLRKKTGLEKNLRTVYGIGYLLSSADS